MTERERKLQRIFDLLNAETKHKFICLLYKKVIIFFFTEKEFLIKAGG